jgi:hypothetical protein
MQTITCDVCGERISEETVHELRIELVNADSLVDTKFTVRQGDFCQACAARVFREFTKPIVKTAA